MELVHKFILDNKYYILDVNTGSFHEVDSLVYDIIGSENLDSLDNILKNLNGKYSKDDISEAYSEIKELKESGILYTEDLYEEIAQNDKSEDFIKALCLNVVHDCNLKCEYCFAEEGEYGGKRAYMSFETAKKAIDFVIKNSGTRNNIEVDLFGGEPLMDFELIKKIVAYGNEVKEKTNKNIRFTMTTNATLLDDEKIEFIDKYMDNLILSIDGRKEVNDSIRYRADKSGTYNSIMPKIKKMVLARSEGKQYYVRGTFTSKNLDFHKDVKHLYDEGFTEISIEPVVLEDNSPLALKKEDLKEINESYDELFKFMKDKKEKNEKLKFYHFNIDLSGGPCIYKRISGCGAGFEYIAITPEGDIYPCHQFIGREEYKMGNIEEGIIKNNIQKELKNAHIYNKPKCKNCWAKFYCSGGCQANNLAFNDDIHIPYEVGCELTKKRIECALVLKSM